MKTVLKYILALTWMFSLFSCVGTIEDVDPQTTHGRTTGSTTLFYYGIRSAETVAHDKIEIVFPSATGDVGRELTYIVQYDGGVTPYFFKSIDLQDKRDSTGNFKVTIKDLEVNTEYIFSVQIKNSKDIFSQAEQTEVATTFW